jgi:hypothetical protein
MAADGTLAPAGRLGGAGAAGFVGVGVGAALPVSGAVLGEVAGLVRPKFLLGVGGRGSEVGVVAARSPAG